MRMKTLTAHRSKTPTGVDKGPPMATKITYCSLETALRHDWSGLKKKQTKELNPSVLFNVLGGCDSYGCVSSEMRLSISYLGISRLYGTQAG